MHEICRPYGKVFTWEVKLKMMGRKQREAGEIFIKELGIPITLDGYCAKIDELQRKFFGDAQLLPGVERLIRHLHAHQVPMAVATGSHRQEMVLKTAKHMDLFSMFAHSVYSTDDPEVKAGKPAPDCFLVAAQRFPDNPDPSKVLVFEDAPNGVLGALAAGMSVVWVPHPDMDRSSLTEQPTLMLDSLVDFKPELFGLPPFNCSS